MNAEEVKRYNELSKREFEKSSVFDVLEFNAPASVEDKWGVFFPFFLFIAGMSVPFFTDEIYAMWFALVPFYAYSFFAVCIDNYKIREKAVETMAAVCGASIVLTLIRYYLLSDMDSDFATMTLMGVFNVPASLSSAIGLYFLKDIF